jgi:S-(hydroxymethyl)glutathione dehydrogenase/alcohol dehydrogenase
MHVDPIRVMVVDDSVVVRRLVTTVLSSDPEIEVVGSASSGRLALDRVAVAVPDLVTLDIEMPVMNGLETLRAIRALYPRLPVIMFSTLTAAGATATLDALAAGASDYLVSDETLPKAVRGLTGGRGADHAFECVGRSTTIRAAWRATRRGGRVTVVGMGRADDEVVLSALDIFSSARTLRSSVYGSSDPDVEIPALARDVLAGTLRLDHLITDRIGLGEVPAAFARMSRGEGVRSVVLF